MYQKESTQLTKKVKFLMKTKKRPRYCEFEIILKAKSSFIKKKYQKEQPPQKKIKFWWENENRRIVNLKLVDP